MTPLAAHGGTLAEAVDRAHEAFVDVGEGPCRVCGYPSWLADEQGPVHLCCSRLPPGEDCDACAVSRARAEHAEKRTADWKAARMRNGFGA